MRRKVYFYTAYERAWHWIQAAAVLVLLATGFEISRPGGFPFLGFQRAVHVHDVVGLVLAVNAFLALFYNLAGGLLRRYIPELDDLFSLGFRHASYYLFGIFRGAPHPFDKTPEKRLLPLQKVTYFLVLNGLLPFMVITGLFKWGAHLDPTLLDRFGGLHVLAPLHRFGAWLFAAFVVVHVYMVTTGRTLSSNLLSMIRGYEVEEGPEGVEGPAGPGRESV